VSAASDVVLIHDAARPFVSTAMIGEAIAAASESGAAIVAIPASDTIKWSPSTPDDATAAARTVERTLPRESVYLAQTPQAFRRDVLRDAVALGRRGVEATDEALLAERAGHTVRLVAGSRRNLKITTPEDLVMAEALLNADSNASAAGA